MWRKAQLVELRPFQLQLQRPTPQRYSNELKFSMLVIPPGAVRFTGRQREPTRKSGVSYCDATLFIIGSC